VVAGTDWAAVTGWATVALAVLALIAAVIGARALNQIGELRASRYGQIVADVATRWTSEELIKSRAQADAWVTPDNIAAEVKLARDDFAHKERYYHLMAEPDFYEDMALLVGRGGLEYKIIYDWIGPGIVARYVKWQGAIQYLRSLPYGSTSYEGWQLLAERIAADVQSGGRGTGTPLTLWEWLRKPLLTIYWGEH
jgi:hypothetical protein